MATLVRGTLVLPVMARPVLITAVLMTAKISQLVVVAGGQAEPKLERNPTQIN